MAAKEQKITLKSLKAKIVTLEEELNHNKNCLGELQKELKNAMEEINNLKDLKTHKVKASVSHKVDKHAHKVKCKLCDDIFDKNFELEVHIKTYHGSETKFECNQCSKTFVLEWRLKKHQGIHKEQNTRKCHYFNNQKKCPFEEIGCMFDHTYSGICMYKDKCDKIMCSFQHKSKELFKCEECEFVVNTETELGKHIDEKHEGWRVTQSFCDYFCRVEHDIHICWSSEDFQDYLGFDIWKTCTTMESDTVVKCLRCDKTDEDIEKMREHIEENHALDKASKCNFCEFEDKTWLGLKKHYKLNHLNKH